MKLLLVAACLVAASATVIKDDNLINIVIGKGSMGKKAFSYFELAKYSKKFLE